MAQDRHYALAREAILAALTAYTGITTADGATPVFNTLIDANLIGKNDFISGKTILIGSGDALYEDKGATSFAPLTGVITLQSAVSAQIKKGTIFRILNISSVEIDVETINAKIGTNADAAGTSTVFARLRQIVDTYLADGTIGLAALKTLIEAVDVAAIEAKLDAFLVLTETGSTLTTDGTEQDVYINDVPAGVFQPLKVMIDFTNQTAAETVVVRTYYRIKSGGALRLKDEVEFAGAQDPPLINIELEPNRFGVRVSIERTAGGAKDYDWEALYSA